MWLEATPQSTEGGVTGVDEAAITDSIAHESILNSRVLNCPTFPGLPSIEHVVTCLGRKGYPLETEILHGGQVVNWLFTTMSNQSCQVLTGFRAFCSREQMKRTMTATNAGSVWHQESNIAMFVPWTRGSRADCAHGWSASFREYVVSAFHECGRPENAEPSVE